MAKKGRYVYEWPRPMVAADAVIFTFAGGKVKMLLVKRRHEPYKDKWALPGGFVDIDEEIEDAALRELEEETGLVGIRLEQMKTFGRCGRDPRARVVTVAFLGIAPEGRCKARAGDDAAEVRWFDIERLPGKMAFDHNEITEFAIKKLKRKKIYQINVKNLPRQTKKTERTPGRGGAD